MLRRSHDHNIEQSNMSGAGHLDNLIAQLERAAEQLRSGELSSDAAATMVEDCAALATQAAAELEQLALAGLRSAEGFTPAPGQDSLL
jgi:exonuclease VII small subunit